MEQRMALKKIIQFNVTIENKLNHISNITCTYIIKNFNEILYILVATSYNW